MAPIRVVQTTVEEIDSQGLSRAFSATGMTRSALCKKAGVHEQYVSRLLRGLVGEVPIDRLYALADAMTGEGLFENGTREDVLQVIRGKASFHLSVVPDPVESATPGSSKGRSHSTLADSVAA